MIDPDALSWMVNPIRFVRIVARYAARYISSHARRAERQPDLVEIDRVEPAVPVKRSEM